MADAGKVAILPRGLWSAETVYEPLDLVYYDNNSYVALKESVGVTPVDGDTWMLSLSGISQETIDAILNGTQQVGDSAKLGGKDASEYALDSDLANYLPTDGSGYMKGALTFYYNGRNVYFQVTSNGRFVLVDSTNGKVVMELSADGQTNAFNGTASGNLPLSGGTVGVNSSTPLIIKRGNLDNVKIQFDGQTGTLGSFGFTAIDNPVYVPSTGSGAQEILHTGNKPTGTYTGNGDATERTINIGGIGDVLYVKNANHLAIVSTSGAIVANDSGVTRLSKEEAFFANGVLILKTTNNALNGNLATYPYELG